LAFLFAQLVRDQAWTAFTAIVTTAITDQGLPPALEGAQADADLAAGAERRWSAFRALRAEGLPLLFQQQQGRHLRHGLLLALQLLLESLEFSLVLGPEFLELLLLSRLGKLAGLRLQGE
jgi:hypothetical protein